jgi:hypothetical protein
VGSQTPLTEQKLVKEHRLQAWPDLPQLDELLPDSQTPASEQQPVGHVDGPHGTLVGPHPKNSTAARQRLRMLDRPTMASFGATPMKNIDESTVLRLCALGEQRFQGGP